MCGLEKNDNKYMHNREHKNATGSCRVARRRVRSRSLRSRPRRRKTAGPPRCSCGHRRSRVPRCRRSPGRTATHGTSAACEPAGTPRRARGRPALLLRVEQPLGRVEQPLGRAAVLRELSSPLPPPERRSSIVLDQVVTSAGVPRTSRRSNGRGGPSSSTHLMEPQTRSGGKMFVSCRTLFLVCFDVPGLELDHVLEDHLSRHQSVALDAERRSQPLSALYIKERGNHVNEWC